MPRPLTPTVRILIMSIVLITMEADMQHLQEIVNSRGRFDVYTLVRFLPVCHTTVISSNCFDKTINLIKRII